MYNRIGWIAGAITFVALGMNSEVAGSSGLFKRGHRHVCSPPSAGAWCQPSPPAVYWTQPCTPYYVYAPDAETQQPSEPPRRTVEQLVTSVARAALAVHNDTALDAGTRSRLLREFEFQIGSVARDQARLESLLSDGIVNRAEIQQFISGEALGISRSLNAR